LLLLPLLLLLLLVFLLLLLLLLLLCLLGCDLGVGKVWPSFPRAQAISAASWLLHVGRTRV
jgi:hypothetical protein